MSTYANKIVSERNGRPVTPTGSTRSLDRPAVCCFMTWARRDSAIIIALITSLYSAYAFRGANLPWTTYEAEDMTNTGTVFGPGYDLLQGESSGRKCVELNATGQYVELIAHQAANAIVVRYSLPDSADGTGIDYHQSLQERGFYSKTAGHLQVFMAVRRLSIFQFSKRWFAEELL